MQRVAFNLALFADTKQSVLLVQLVGSQFSLCRKKAKPAAQVYVFDMIRINIKIKFIERPRTVLLFEIFAFIRNKQSTYLPSILFSVFQQILMAYLWQTCDSGII